MRFTLQKKILAGYGTALVLTAGVLGFAIYNITALGQASDSILRENYISIQAANRMIEALAQQDRAALLFLHGLAPEGIELQARASGEFHEWLARAKDNITEPGEREIVQAVETNALELNGQFEDFRSRPDRSSDRGWTRYLEALWPQAARVLTELHNLRDINQAAMYKTSVRAGGLAAQAALSMAILGGIGLTAGLGFSIALSRIVTSPLKKIIKATEQLAGGSYDVRLETRSSDELGVLAGSFQKMAAEIKAFNDMNIGQILMEKRKSESIIQAIDDGIVLVDEALMVVTMNPTARKFLNASVALPAHILEIINDHALIGLLREAVRTGTVNAPPGESPLIAVHSRGGARYYQRSVTPITVDNKKQIGVVLLLRDVTKLKEIDRLKSDFIITASHELKTPLHSIGMSVELLKESLGNCLGAGDVELLQAAGDEVARLKALVADLLDLSRIESGKVELNIKPVAPSRIVAAAAVRLAKQAEQAGIGLVTGCSCSGPVLADEDKLLVVLGNLIGNAIKYGETVKTIELGCRADGEHCRFSVRDDGIGIPEQYHATIFDKFVRVPESSGKSGTGLGLSICREIVRAHGGIIWVATPAQGGCEFSFTIPTTDPARNKEKTT